MKFRLRFFWFVVLSYFLIALQIGYPVTIHVRQAGVACSEPLAAAEGVKVLQEGGNAIDALVTVAFTMSVTYPRAGNIGGGGFLIYYEPGKNPYALDFRETAPAKATYDMYWDEKGVPIPQKSLLGALAVGVPGTVKGLYEAHQKFGKLPWKRLLQPAIRYALSGFPVYDALHQLLKRYQERFRSFPESYRIFYPGGKVPAVGDLLIQKDLGRTLQLIAEGGEAAFYEGSIASLLEASMKKHGGLITRQDLKNYRAMERQPIMFEYRGYRIISMPPPSSGGLVMEGILNTLSEVDLSEKYEHNGADYMALVSEVEKHWFAARNLYLGDPDFVKIPFQLFSSPQTARKILGQVSVEHPFPSVQMPEYQEIRRQAESTQTTHISILDPHGNAVSMTYTLNGNFGSYLVAEGTGILLNNEMDDFAARPGYPNLFDLIQGKANEIQPGKRMLSSMTPTIVLKDNRLEGIVGTPGGSTIITTVLQMLLNKIDYSMSLDNAINSGRFHQQWLPDTIYYEKGKFSPSVLSELKKRGFGIRARTGIGDVQAIWRNGSEWDIASDPRSTGIPKGF